MDVLPPESYLTENEPADGSKEIEEQISEFLIKIKDEVYLPELWRLVYCIVDICQNSAEQVFSGKAPERGDAVASLSEDNAVRWKPEQGGLAEYQWYSTLVYAEHWF